MSARCEEIASALSLFSRVSDLVALSFYLDLLEPSVGSSSLRDSLKVLDSCIPCNLPFGLLVTHKRSQLDIHMDPKCTATVGSAALETMEDDPTSKAVVSVAEQGQVQH